MRACCVHTSAHLCILRQFAPVTIASWTMHLYDSIFNMLIFIMSWIFIKWDRVPKHLYHQSVCEITWNRTTHTCSSPLVCSRRGWAVDTCLVCVELFLFIWLTMCLLLVHFNSAETFQLKKDDYNLIRYTVKILQRPCKRVWTGHQKVLVKSSDVALGFTSHPLLRQKTDYCFPNISNTHTLSRNDT